MSAYENVVAGKLGLKGKALDVKSSGIKKKKKHKHQYDLVSQVTGGNNALTTNQLEDDIDDFNLNTLKREQAAKNEDHLIPAERRYLEQWEKLNIKRLAKEAMKSHRDRIQEFNRYLANLTEHYGIPKVGPG